MSQRYWQIQATLLCGPRCWSWLLGSKEARMMLYRTLGMLGRLLSTLLTEVVLNEKARKEYRPWKSATPQFQPLNCTCRVSRVTPKGLLSREASLSCSYMTLNTLDDLWNYVDCVPLAENHRIWMVRQPDSQLKVSCNAYPLGPFDP